MATRTHTLRKPWAVGGLAAQMRYNVFGRDATGAYVELVARSGTGVFEERTGNYAVHLAGWDTAWKDWVVYWDQNSIDEAEVGETAVWADVTQVNGKPARPESGDGAYVVTVTVTNAAGGAPIVGASVRMSDGGGTYYTTTNGSGVATFNLDASTYTLAVFQNGFLYASTAAVVTAAGNFAAAMTAVSFSAPADPTQTTAYLVTRDGRGNVKPGATITFRLVDPVGTAPAGAAFDRRNFTATSDGAGLLQVALMRQSHYAMRHEKGDWIDVPDTGNAGTFALPEVLSEYGS